MRVFFVIAARGGSKGVPKKNLVMLGGVPLVAYKIITANKCRFDNRIIVSTDDNDIAAVARTYGAEVPFMRPDYLATDEASSIDVVLHAMEWLEKNDESPFDYICLLEPSSPFLSGDDLNKAIEIMIEKDADTLLGIRAVDTNRIFINELDSRGGLSKFYYALRELDSVRRQDQCEEYTLNGCIYLAKYSYFKEHKSFHSINSIPFIMAREYSIEIDTYDDLEYARYLIERRIIDIGLWLK